MKLKVDHFSAAQKHHNY